MRTFVHADCTLLSLETFSVIKTTSVEIWHKLDAVRFVDRREEECIYPAAGIEPEERKSALDEDGLVNERSFSTIAFLKKENLKVC